MNATTLFLQTSSREATMRIFESIQILSNSIDSIWIVFISLILATLVLIVVPLHRIAMAEISKSQKENSFSSSARPRLSAREQLARRGSF
jgi:hypothetical protein